MNLSIVSADIHASVCISTIHLHTYVCTDTRTYVLQITEQQCLYMSCTFSFLTSSALLVAGFSIAVKQRTCNRWFCITSLRGVWLRVGEGRDYVQWLHSGPTTQTRGEVVHDTKAHTYIRMHTKLQYECR